MAAYLEIEPADRPINMLGRPVIRLYTSGGPGEALGSFGGRMSSGMGCCGSLPSMADLGCCGGGSPARKRSSGMGQTSSVADQATLLKGHCDKLDDAVASLVTQIQKVQNNSALSDDTKAALTNGLVAQLRSVKKTFKQCFKQLHSLVVPNNEALAAGGMGQLVTRVKRRAQTILNQQALARVQARTGGR